MTFHHHWVMYYTILRKEVVRVLRIWPQSLLPPAITMALYFLIFGEIVGRRVGDVYGFDYTTFIAPGLIAMAAINNAYSNVVSSFYGSRFSHAIEELLVSPTSNHIIILGYISGGVARGVFAGIIVTVVALLFDGMHMHHGLLFVLALFVCCALFALGGLLNGIFSQSFDDTTIFPTFILVPLTYLGGVFYTLSMLSEPWHTIAYFNPIFYIIQIFKYASLGISAVNPWLSFSVVIVICILFYGVILHCLNKGVRLKP